MEVTRIEAV